MKTAMRLLAAIFLASLPLTTFAVYSFGPTRPYSAASGTPKSGEGFPLWYQDDQGYVCQPCLHVDPAGTGVCLSTVTSATETVDEFFYFQVSAELTVPSTGVVISWENAVEGAYIQGPPVRGDEMVFQRTRIRIDCPATPPPAGKPYTFVINTPYEKNLVLAADEGASGKRCLSYTADIGTTGNFADNLAGPITSYLQAPAAGRTAGQYGNFPDVGQVSIPGSSTPAVLSATSPASDTGTSAFQEPLVSTDQFTSSCEQYQGSTLTINKAHILAKDADTAYVEVWATAGPNEQIAVTVDGLAGVVVAMQRNAEPSLNPPAQQFAAPNKPANYFAHIPITRRPANINPGAWRIVVTATSGNTVIKYPVAPRILGKVVYDGKDMKVSVKADDPAQDFTIGVMAQDGTFQPFGIVGSTVSAQPSAQNPSGRKMLQATPSPPISHFVGSCEGAVGTVGAPDRVWACWGEINGPVKKSKTAPGCTSFGVQYDTATGIFQAPALTINVAGFGPESVPVGFVATLDGSASTPAYGVCTGEWRQVAGQPVGGIADLGNYQASFTAPNVPGGTILSFKLTITCGSQIADMEQPVTINVLAAAPSYKLSTTAQENLAFFNQLFSFAPILKTLDDQAVAGASYKVTTTNCVCGSNGCFNAADTAKPIQCRPGPDTFAVVNIAASLLVNGSPTEVATLDATFRVQKDTLISGSIRLEIESAAVGSPWNFRLEAGSTAAQNYEGVTMRAYYTGQTNCALSNPTGKLDEECAQTYGLINNAFPCEFGLTGTCVFRGAATLTGPNIVRPNKNGAWFVYLTTTAGFGGSFQATIKK